jgi:hypothetical protein
MLLEISRGIEKEDGVRITAFPDGQTVDDHPLPPMFNPADEADIPPEDP